MDLDGFGWGWGGVGRMVQAQCRRGAGADDCMGRVQWRRGGAGVMQCNAVQCRAVEGRFAHPSVIVLHQHVHSSSIEKITRS